MGEWFVVFDLDGTLALDEHRIHYIRNQPKDYDAFYAACVDDKICVPVMLALNAHLLAGHRVEIWTTRSEQVRTQTKEWLERHHIAPSLVTRMRPKGDRQLSIKLKHAWLQQARANGGGPDIVYEDRQSLVDMWRKEGVTCFQVAPAQH